MEKEKQKDGFWDYVLGVIIVVGFIWLLVSNGGRGGFGCYEDKYGNEVCSEDPRG